eukprot:SAG31_NODE_962_length_10731_cov_4.198552_7_plen_428_part_00
MVSMHPHGFSVCCRPSPIRLEASNPLDPEGDPAVAAAAVWSRAAAAGDDRAAVLKSTSDDAPQLKAECAADKNTERVLIPDLPGSSPVDCAESSTTHILESAGDVQQDDDDLDGAALLTTRKPVGKFVGRHLLLNRLWGQKTFEDAEEDVQRALEEKRRAAEAREAARAKAESERLARAEAAAMAAEAQRVAEEAKAAAAAEAARLAAGKPVTLSCDCCGTTDVDPPSDNGCETQRKLLATRYWGGFLDEKPLQHHGGDNADVQPTEESAAGNTVARLRRAGIAGRLQTLKLCPRCAELQQLFTEEQRELERHIKVEQTILRERQAAAAASAGGGSGKAADYQIIVLRPLQGKHGAAQALDEAHMLALEGHAIGKGVIPDAKLPQLTSLYHARDLARPSTRARHDDAQRARHPMLRSSISANVESAR